MSTRTYVEARDRDSKTEGRVKHVRDVPYAGTKSSSQRLDIMLPENPQSKKLPVVAFFHGGGWMSGDKESGYHRMEPTVAQGVCIGVTIGYRLSGKAKWPAQIHDGKAAIRWIRGNAERYGMDPERIAIFGTSAGGHLAALIGTTGDNPELEGTLGKHLGQSSRVSCAVEFFGPTDLLAKPKVSLLQRLQRLKGGKKGKDKKQVERLLGGTGANVEDAARQASPLYHVSPDDPPFLIAHGTRDRTVPIDQSIRFHQALLKAGVPSTFIKVEGAGHGIRSRELEIRAQQFLDFHLRGVGQGVDDSTIEADVATPL